MEFVYFGNDWRAENRTSSHHIARRLGASFPLLYVESPGLRAPKANARDLRKLFAKLCRTLHPPQMVAPHFWVMTLPQIPFRRLRAIRAVNRIFSRLLVRRAMRNLGFHSPVAWFHVPHPGFLARKLGEVLTVYYCIDEYANLPDVDSVAVQAIDDELTRAADVVFACNQNLLDVRRRLNTNLHLSPHGVDTEMFSRAGDPGAEIPAAIRNLQRPVVGSWGLVDQRVDQSILKHIACARPNWTILLIGRLAVEAPALKRLPNVVFTGAIPYAELPNWAAAIDVCILPYTQVSLNLQSSPLKLREYLASGKPVVAVPLPEVMALGPVVQTARDGPGFVCAIEAAVAHDTPGLAALRRQAVANNSWDNNVARIMDTLRTELQIRAHREQQLSGKALVDTRQT